MYVVFIARQRDQYFPTYITAHKRGLVIVIYMFKPVAIICLGESRLMNPAEYTAWPQHSRGRRTEDRYLFRTDSTSPRADVEMTHHLRLRNIIPDSAGIRGWALWDGPNLSLFITTQLNTSTILTEDYLSNLIIRFKNQMPHRLLNHSSRYFINYTTRDLRCTVQNKYLKIRWGGVISWLLLPPLQCVLRREHKVNNTVRNK